MTRYAITPVPKPRMTRSDKWKKRPSVLRYRAFADEARMQIKESLDGANITFYIPMPKSWSKAKKERTAGTAHRQKPDIDNLAKALFDALYDDDSCISSVRLAKCWAWSGSIVIEQPVSGIGVAA